MFCFKCGFDLPNDANFCRNCGEDLRKLLSGKIGDTEFPLIKKKLKDKDESVYIENLSFNKSNCPYGHGELRKWEGKLRCWKCGYEPSFEKLEFNVTKCPRGHGTLKEWNGKLRCWKCGFPEK